MSDGTTLDQTAPAPRDKGRLVDPWLLLGILGVAVLLVLSLFTGVVDVLDGSALGREMFGITRIPRTVALVLAGAAMAMSGLVMQMLTQNRFVEPTTVGTTEWAGLGLLLMLLLFPTSGLLLRMVGAITMAFIGTMVFFLFLRQVKLTSSLVVPIVGIMLGAVVGAVTSYIALANDALQSLGVWFAGSFTSVLRGQYEVLWVVALVVVAVFVVADRFTVAGLGEDVATNVGLNYRAVMLLGTALIAVATGVVTVVIGNLPFLGLIVPNIISMWRGDDLRSNLPWVCLLGVAIVTVCDLLARTLIAPFELPVSVILGVVGAAVFIGLLLGRRRV
ncbi:iron chelate uptake ABC transporter family permease subunit [Kytococcus sedentarius]|uniref:ABC-type enterochelin transport system, permease component n=1 Tax=Kytococcus sedentarius (strain ATCC 14392 / DSM 20547 / JCM 11482 / CCUG 33030 / NBRC 15357 / NCTC 11040 / CCM 314 / 541) TaxID=478801 RepID=C7NG88_KYTSD|nr:iron chelate uptake ABC transporter family permease subunit [Kytococcus sedentarius]ACV07497.1 ABC-type enterochelin transport system, permease component [Kytococcus sedentarius DSM 20547]QQB63435.1 iron chelate uptake ABC transporter family permease subunit [Kytococcus sedentarius]STX13654.1 Iron-uptake system permease protein FeuB [Kytococcus sedentarius]